MLLAVIDFLFVLFFLYFCDSLYWKHLHFVKSPFSILPCVLWEFKLVIDLKLPPLSLPLARDLHLAGSGWWVDQIFTRWRVDSGALCYDQLLLFVLLILSF